MSESPLSTIATPNDSSSRLVVRYHPRPGISTFLGFLALLAAANFAAGWFSDQVFDPVVFVSLLGMWLIVRLFERELVIETIPQKILIRGRWLKRVYYEAPWSDDVYIERPQGGQIIGFYTRDPVEGGALIFELSLGSIGKADQAWVELLRFMNPGREVEIPEAPSMISLLKTFSGAMLILNSAIFLGSLAIDPAPFFLQREAFFGGQYYRLLTYMFLHANILHIVFNMTALLQLGTLLEAIIGWKRVAILYFISGIVGGWWALFWIDDQPLVGASGAIFGLFGAIAYLVMNATKLGMPQEFLPSRQALFKVLALNAVISLLPMVSLAGHIGGFVAGYICAFVLLRDRSRAL